MSSLNDDIRQLKQQVKFLLSRMERPFEARFIDTATSPASSLRVTVPSYDGGDHHFGPVVWSPLGNALPAAGDRALVAESDDGSWWVLSWWSSGQASGARVATQSPVTGTEAVQTVTSTTFVDIADMALTVTTNGRPMLLTANVRIGAVTGGVGILTYGIDATADVASPIDGITIVQTSNVPVSLPWLATGLAAGSHTFKVRARVTAGSMDITHGRRERLIAVEL